MRRAGITTFAAIFGGMVLGSSIAKAKEDIPLHATLLVNAQATPDQSAVAKRGRAVLSGTVLPVRLVRLNGSVEEAAGIAVAAQGSDLQAGAVLYLVDQAKGIYCGGIHSAGLAKAGPCLIDGDGDGRFEAAAKGRSMAVSPQGLAFADNNKVMGIDIIQQTPLAAPVAYSDVGNDSGISGTPFAPTRLYWMSNFNKKKPGPVLVRFFFDASNDWAGTGLASGPYSANFDGAPVDVKIGGLTITITGLTPKGELEYRIAGKIAAEPVPFRFHNRQTTIWIFI